MSGSDPGSAAPTPPNANIFWAMALLDVAYAAGVRHLSICPGSRSAPLAIAAAWQRRIRISVHHDERSAAFFALGVARGSSRPAAVLSTSGTAAANFHPAVIEASHSMDPLLVLTADRPHELRDAGAPQTIDQIRLFGGSVRAFREIAPPELDAGSFRAAVHCAAWACAALDGNPPGPVHLNLPFREPLAPVSADREAIALLMGSPDATTGPVFLRAERTVSSETIARVHHTLADAQRAWIVTGPRAARTRKEAAAIEGFAEAWHLPILADVASGVRFGASETVLPCADAILRGTACDEERPDLVIRFGDLPTSKSVNQFLGRHRPRLIVVQDHANRVDPDAAATEVIQGDAAGFCRTMAALGDAPAAAAQRPGMFERMRRDARRCRDFLAGARLPLEASAIRGAVEALPERAILFLSNSMPIRWAETYLDHGPSTLEVRVSRGANGIDGIASTALGLALGSGKPLLLVEGDLAFLHDLGGWIAAREIRSPFAALVLNNGGGGIFAHLQIADFPELHRPYFHTPHALNIEAAVAAVGLDYAPAETAEDVREQVVATMEHGGVRVIELRTDAIRMAAEHREVLTGVERLLLTAGR
jgi:2-succinyl-5-enolpyruvyl-6-hydroxy-3-cyclohexene-1-carboxylate synthase